VKTKFALMGLCVFSFVLPILAWTENTGGIYRLFDIHQPPGQSWYVISRLFGLLALTACCWQFFIGLSRKYPTPLFSKAKTLRKTHASLGLISFILFWSHALCFTTAVSIRKELVAYQFLLPNVSDHYHSIISIGWLALMLVSIAVAARIFGLRHQDKWHKLVYAVFPIALLHSYLVGSDTRDTAMILFYVVLALVWCGAIYMAYFKNRIETNHAPVA